MCALDINMFFIMVNNAKCILGRDGMMQGTGVLVHHATCITIPRYITVLLKSIRAFT